MNWFMTAVLIATLVAFNLFAADTMMKMRVDVKEILKIVRPPNASATTALLPAKPATAATPPTATAAAAATPKTATQVTPKKK